MVAINMCSRKSSSLVLEPLDPIPPLDCVLKFSQRCTFDIAHVRYGDKPCPHRHRNLQD